MAYKVFSVPEAPDIKTMNRKEGKTMDFLKAILGDELYGQVAEKLNAYNGDEKNKDKQVKLVDLGSGEYVSKLKYQDLETSLNSKGEELSAANSLIEELKKKTGKDDRELQEKISSYETTVSELQDELAKTKIESALKVALLSEKAKDVDYLTFKINEDLKKNGENLELDGNGAIKGWDSRLEGLKTQFPDMFEKKSDKEDERLDEQRLPEGDDRKAEPNSLAEALKMRDEERE